MPRSQQIFLLVACLGLPCAFAADYPVTCVAEDYVICEGPPAFSVQGNTTIRIGANNNNGSPGGRNAVMIFPLPVLGAGEQPATTTLTVNVAGRSGSPSFTADLWGIGFQAGTPPLLEYCEANTGDTGNTKLQDNVGARSAMEDKVLAELKKHFRPEFLNRVADVIIFQSLDENELARIMDIQLGRLEQRLAQQNLTLDVDAAAKKLLASEGYDPQFGARPLKRAIQEHLLDPLATKLLDGSFKPGDQVKVSAKDGELAFLRK